MKQAPEQIRGFRDHCPASWPKWARSWAGSSGSLTARLVSVGMGFAVQPTDQGLSLLTAEQAFWLNQSRSAKVRTRGVHLQVGDEVVVAARTWMLLNGSRCDWRFWNGLGKRSLGTMLFSDPLVKRGKVYYRQLPAVSPWVVRLLGAPLYQDLLSRYRPSRWYVRAARFTRAPHHTPLWVFEVFLPGLQKNEFGMVE